MDSTTFELLNLINSRNSLSLFQLATILDGNSIALADPIHWMMNHEYLRKTNDSENLEGDIISLDTQLQITYAGKIAIEQYKKDKKHFKYIELRAWLTLIIALCAFIKSFFF